MQRILVGLFSAIVACAVVAVSARAQAQLFDHLKCHRVKDQLNLKGLVDLEALQPQFSDSGCKLRRARLFCVPVSKTLLRPPLVHPELVGQSLTDDYICYKTKCPVRPADEEVSDQLGTRTLTRFRTSLLCVPARKGLTTTTTTTTTLPGGQTCEEISQSYFAALFPAKQCVFPAASLQCGFSRALEIGCDDCPTFVNNPSELDQLRAAWDTMGCTTVVCPFCFAVPTAGDCSPTGICQDVFQ